MAIMIRSQLGRPLDSAQFNCNHNIILIICQHLRHSAQRLEVNLIHLNGKKTELKRTGSRRKKARGSGRTCRDSSRPRKLLNINFVN